MYVSKMFSDFTARVRTSKISMCATNELVGDRQSIPLFYFSLFEFAVKQKTHDYLDKALSEETLKSET